MFQRYKKIHFVGVGGIGVSALAKWALLDGVKVSGSDVADSEITEELRKMGAEIFTGHKKENVPKGAGLIIYSDAVPKDNPERKNKILQKSYFEALGEITKQKKAIAISGTNGKSTTTAMLGKIFIDAGYDPAVIVGSKIKDFKYGNFHPGKGEYFIVEACEHNAHMLNLAPQHIVITNIEADHLDFYKNLENIIVAFKKYVAAAPDNGLLVFNADDKNTLEVIRTAQGKKIGYGLSQEADFCFENRDIKDGRQTFDFLAGKNKLGGIALGIPGLFNVYNAMAAAVAAHSIGIPFQKISKSLAEFHGLWRRFEEIGKFKGAPVISDYGHHPQAIAATLLAAREFYPERRVILAFEPHQHHRTKALFADFVRSFDTADVVILSDIYNVAGRLKTEDTDISSKILAEAVVKYWETAEDVKEKKIHEMYYASDSAETEAKLRKIVKRGDIVIIMGAGNIYKLAMRLCGT